MNFILSKLAKHGIAALPWFTAISNRGLSSNPVRIRIMFTAKVTHWDKIPQIVSVFPYQ
jgi:hypothetical protein